jgi:hypothetical protein
MTLANVPIIPDHSIGEFRLLGHSVPGECSSVVEHSPGMLCLKFPQQLMVGYRRHIDDTIASYIRNAVMTEFSVVAEAKIIEAKMSNQ